MQFKERFEGKKEICMQNMQLHKMSSPTYMYALLETIILEFFKKNVAPFQSGSQITDFYFASFQFWPKFEKPLSQRNFSMKFWLKVGEHE